MSSPFEPSTMDVAALAALSRPAALSPPATLSTASALTAPVDRTRPAGSLGPRPCSIADALEVIGDRYSLLVLREVTLGVRRFNDIRQNTGAPRETLTARLRKLEEAGVIERHRYSEHPPRDEYLLTEAGQALRPVLGSLKAWGAKYVSPDGIDRDLA